MPISMAELAVGIDNSGGSFSTTASFTTTANRLVLLFMMANTGGASNMSPANANGLTWVNIYDGNIYTLDSGNSGFGVWRAMASSGSSGTMGISHTNGAILWEIVEFASVDTSGTNGSGAIAKTATNSGGGSGTLTITFSGATSASNAIVGFFGAHDGNAAIAVGSGFTSINTYADGTINNRFRSEWLNGVSQSVCDASISAGSSSLGFGFEIAAGGGGAPTTGSPSGLVVGAGF